jgi:hypothetical protein
MFKELPNDKMIDPRNFAFCLNFGYVYFKWIQFENLMLKLVESLYFDLFITFCIILNTIIMALQHDDQPIEIEILQTYSNFIISSIFIAEGLCRMIAYGKLYFLDSSSWFDLFITLLTIIDFSLPNVQGLSIFRSFRLVSVLNRDILVGKKKDTCLSLILVFFLNFI